MTRTSQKASTVISLDDLHMVGARNAVEAASIVHRMWKGMFLMRFKRRIIPMVLQRVLLHGHTIFVFQIAYEVDQTTGFTGMRIVVGMSAEYIERIVTANDPLVPNDAYVALIHALPKNRWKGSDMVELALGIARALGVRRATLHDHAFQTCTEEGAPELYGFDLSLILLLSRQISFYGRYGFRPAVRSLSDRAWLTSDDTIKDLCSTLSKLRNVHVSSFTRYLKSMLRVLDPPAENITVGYRLLRKNFQYGVLHTETMQDTEMRASIPIRVSLMRRLSQSLKDHKKGLFLELFEGTKLACKTKADFLQLLSMDYPILRLGLKGPTKAGTHDIEWPAWTFLKQVQRIRSMYMEAIVHQDPALQRVATFCPQAHMKSNISG